MQRVLKAAQAARFLGCNPQKVRVRMESGDWQIGNVVPAKKNGKQKEYDIFPQKLADMLGINVEEIYKFFEEGEE